MSVQAFVLDSVHADSKVLDVGCGGGGISQLLLSEKKCEVWGVEPNKNASKVAESRRLKVFNGTLEEFVSDKANCHKFQYVLLTDVLEHLYDPLDALEKMSTTLIPSGKLILTVPNVAHWKIRLSLLFGRFDYTKSGLMDYTHIRWFTKKSLKQVLKEAGYNVESIKYTLGSWLFPYSLLPQRLRPLVFGPLVYLWPSFFGCQICVVAQNGNSSNE